MYRWDQKVILAKIEAVEGTDAAPTGVANAILARNLAFDPNPSTLLARDLVKPTVGPVARPVAGRHVVLSFDVEFAGAGGVAVAPKWGPLMRGCGMAETITPATGPVVYDPVSVSEESVSIYFNIDGVNHAALMCRGSVALAVEPNEVPLLRFAFTGLHVAPAAGNVAKADAPKVQVHNPRYQEVDGIAYLAMDLNVAEDTGDDEIRFSTI